MAEECRDVISAINLVKGQHLGRTTITQLEDATKHLTRVAVFLTNLEKRYPENGISGQLRPLFLEARDGFSEICSRFPRFNLTIKMGNIAEKFKASKASKLQMISEVLKIIEHETIAKRIRASKPSRSSSRITMEMVGFVESLLGSVHRALFFISVGPAASLLDKKLRHLRVFFTLIAKRCIEHESMKDLFNHVEDVAYTAAYLCFLGSNCNMDGEFSKLLERVSRPFIPELRQIYLSALIGLKSSSSETTTILNAKYMLDFVSALREDLRPGCDGRIRWLQRGLSYLSRFLRDVESYPLPLGEVISLRLNMEALAIGAANAIYSSYDEHNTTEIDDVLFHLQLKFNYVKVEIDLIRLLTRQAAITIGPMKSLIDYVWSELIFFRNYFMDALKQFNEETKITVILTSIQSAISQAWSVCDSLCHDSEQEDSISNDTEQEDLVREMINCLHFQLLLKFKFIKAAIRQMYPSISASSTLDHPTISLLNFLPMNFEVIDSYFSMLKSSNTSSPHRPMMDEVLMGFHEYILKNLLLKDETNLTFTIAGEVKKFYGGLLLLVTYLIEPLVPHIECREQNNVSMGYGTIAIEAQSAMSLSYEDSMNSNNCREVNLVLQFLTVAFWLIKSEGSLMDILKHKATLEYQVLDLIESAREELIFIRSILMDLLRQHTELNKLDDILMHAEVTAKKLAILSDSCYEIFQDGSSTDIMRPWLSDSLQEIESVKVEFRKVCSQVLDVSPLTMTDGEGLINFLLNHQDKVPNNDAASFNESFMDGSSSENLELSSSDFLGVIESVKVEEVRNACNQVVDASPYEMRKTDGEGFINLLLTQQNKVLEYDTGSIFFLHNQISVVKDKLLDMGSLLVDIVRYRNMHLELKDLAKRIQDKNYICFFSIKGYIPAWYYTLYLSDVKQLIKLVEAEVKTICLKVPDSSSYSFPKTNGLGFLNCFLGKLEELLCSKLDLAVDLNHQIGSVKEGLLYLTSLIGHFSENYDEHDEVYGLITSVTVLAYKAEYVIDSCLAYSHPLWYKVLWISEVVENIKIVNKVVRETCERNKFEVTVHEVAKTSTNLAPSFSDNTQRTNEEMEGFQDTMDELKEQLLGGSPQLDVISIVGMPGLGKTTLAKKIYNDPTVTSHFDVHAQCLVTQIYSWRELLLTILNDVLEPADRNEKEDGELADELRRFLLTKRFLILIDDVWDNKVWDNLHMCFRDVRNGSRIILTTRLSDIANYVKCESDPHHLRLFRDDESWTLLQKEVFQGETCPPELADVGSRIARRCRGLPLSVVLVAGVLKQKKKKLDLWKVVEESLGSQSIGSLEESMSIIGFSYKNLPHYLKPCFLYFGGFLQGKDIHVSKLTRLWEAEGFVQANKEKRQDDAAQGFLEDLIRRNLVMGMEKRPNTKVKTCRVHDLLHKFCMEKAKLENFLLQINSGEDVFPEQLEEYRLFVHSYQDEIDLWRPSRSNIRSLLFNAIDLDNLLWPRDISFIFDSFKLVKVLDLESFNIGGTFPSEIQYLIQMRYFAAQTDANSIPSSIAKLGNLETFVVRGLGGEMILPCSLLKMVKLRHIHVNHRVSFGLHENMDESLSHSQLANLETFSTPRLSYGEDAEKILRKMPKLRKLSCIFSGTFGYSRKVMGRCVRFPRLEFLSHLESLKLVSNSYPAKLPHKFNFPSQLRELTLSKFRLPWNQISTIAELRNLVILKLSLRAFEGDHWEVKDSDFPELKYLKLDNLKVAQWSVSYDAFPKLEHLVLTKCKHLEKIPSHFDDAVSLKSIEVNWCNWSVANSAQEIQTTQREDMANDSFTVTIQPPDWAKRSSP
uniref:Late blight resistance protein homolog R1A-4 isoform X3 n=1 Tax=Nicotiana sylvestris TaxID=4096 RepID=A0A1U7XHP5_NICSY|nr:PREDICTED: putative late blight resistance protein homolog R1A-4 isoform X3 [Nicotiana sylvestris]